jgi:hypothetical protein
VYNLVLLSGRRGMLIKGGKVLDALGSCGTVAFDKTGASQPAALESVHVSGLPPLLGVSRDKQPSSLPSKYPDNHKWHLEQAHSLPGRSHAAAWHASTAAQAAAAAAPKTATAQLTSWQVGIMSPHLQIGMAGSCASCLQQHVYLACVSSAMC